MSEFYADRIFLNRTHLFTRYYSIISCISLKSFEVERVMYSLKKYSGFGIGTQVDNLRKCCKQLEEYRENVRTELKSLVKIIDTINEYEKKAVGILGGESTEDFVIANPSDIFSSKKISHTDLGKIVNQFKYYSQLSDKHKKFYEQLVVLYNFGQTVEMSDEEYKALKDLFHYYTQRGYVYSNVSYFKAGYSNSLNADADMNVSYSDGKLKGSIGCSMPSLEYKGTVDSMFIETAFADGEGNYVTYTIQLSGIEVKESVNINSLDISSVLESIDDGKMSMTKFNSLFSPFGIEASASTFAFKAVSTTIMKINDSVSFYDKVEYTIGELSAKASIDASGVEAKAGYAVAAVKASLGFKTNNGTYAVNGKVSAGQEYGFTAKPGEAEGNVGMFGLGLENGDGFDYYIWE